MLLNRLYILFLFLIVTLVNNNNLFAKETEKMQAKLTNNVLILSLDIMSMRYLTMKYENDKDSNYLFYKFNNMRIGVNPFYKLENKYLQKFNIKFGFGIGGFDDTYYNNQNIILLYNIVSSTPLTLYFGYVIFNCYNFRYLQGIDTKTNLEIKSYNSLGRGIVLGLNITLYKNFSISIEYQDIGKYHDNIFDSKGINFGITYKIPLNG